jgi:hypothetical protein
MGYGLFFFNNRFFNTYIEQLYPVLGSLKTMVGIYYSGKRDIFFWRTSWETYSKSLARPFNNMRYLNCFDEKNEVKNPEISLKRSVLRVVSKKNIGFCSCL